MTSDVARDADITLPGFVDLQVNGFQGVDFSDPQLSLADASRALRRVLASGTAALLATIITSPIQVYRRNIPMLAKLSRSDEFAGRVLGLHLEGPFISREPGTVGAHDPRYVVAPDLALLRELLDLGDGTIRLITVAAEVPAADVLARYAQGRGVAVSVGHSFFCEDDLDRMFAAGATALTHLGNGLPNLLPRHVNPIWAGLADDRFSAMVIADGHHLPVPALKSMVRALGPDRLVVVSDASPVAGLPPGEYDVLGNRAILEPSGRLYNPEKQCLVGSTATMLECMNVLASLDNLSLDALVAAGFTNPLRLISADPSEIASCTRVGYSMGRFSMLAANPT